MQMVRSLGFLVAFILLAALPVRAADSAPSQRKPASEYTVTVIPYYSPEKLWPKFQPLVDYLRESTGKPWTLKLYPNHEETINALCSGAVGLALLGPIPLARSIEKCGADIVAVAIGSDGTLFYQSVIVTTDPTVRDLSQLRGKQIGLFKGSTAAHIMPMKMLRTAGLGKSDVRPVFFEGQDRIMTALLNGEVTAAGMKDVLYKRFHDSRLHVVKISASMPNFAFAASPLLSSRTKSLFSKSLLRLNPGKSARDREQMLGWDDEIRNGFVAPPDSYYSSVMDLFSAYQEVTSEK